MGGLPVLFLGGLPPASVSAVACRFLFDSPRLRGALDWFFFFGDRPPFPWAGKLGEPFIWPRTYRGRQAVEFCRDWDEAVGRRRILRLHCRMTTLLWISKKNGQRPPAVANSSGGGEVLARYVGYRLKAGGCSAGVRHSRFQEKGRDKIWASEQPPTPND